jgi:hypothetical protein
LGCSGREHRFGRELGSAPSADVLRRRSPKRPVFSTLDRVIFICLYPIAPRILDAVTIVQPATVVRWHALAFACSGSLEQPGGPVPLEVRQLIREMSLANPLWGAPRIHGELLKLGINLGQTSVAKYMARRRRPPSQGWRTFLLNHADGIASIDPFVVPTISFRLLYGLLVLRHDRRRILWLGVTWPSDCRMDRPANHRGMWLGERVSIPHP